MLSTRALIVEAILILFLGFAIGYKAHTPTTIEVPTPVDRPVVEFQLPPTTVLSLDMSDLLFDLQSYPHLSAKHKLTIIEAIQSASKQFDINPLILYSIIHVESSFRWWLVHATPSTKDKEPALGLGGIRPSIWGDQLKSANIIQVKADLFDISANIHATAYVYNQLRSDPMHKSATNRDMSAMLKYFGGDYIDYFNKVNSKIIQLTQHRLYKD